MIMHYWIPLIKRLILGKYNMLTGIRNSFFIAYRYLWFHKIRSAILIVSLSIIIIVPAFLEILATESQQKLTFRANSTPLLLGKQGSSLDLAVNSLYFISKKPTEITIADAHQVDDTELGHSIPLYTRFNAQNNPIIGTSSEYFDFRNLKVSQGRSFAFLGEAVIGANVAKKEKLKTNDTLISSSENLFDLAGVYPLQMNVVGVLDPTGTADDNAVFVDIRTTWVMAGLGHGHEDLATTDDASVLLKRNNNTVVANAKLRTYNRITPNNIDSFHFHGNEDKFPISSAIIVPNDHKSKSIILGRYQTQPKNIQIIQPNKTINELVQSIFQIKKMLNGVVFTVSASTLLTIFLAFLLSIRLREKEIQTITRLGCSRRAIMGFITAEIVIIATASLLLATALLISTQELLEAVLLRYLM